MTVPGSLILAGAVFATSVASLLAAQPARAQEWLRWQGASTPVGVDPAKLVSPAARPPAPLPATSRPVPEPAVSAAVTRQARNPAQTDSTQALLTPALANPVALTEPLPAPVGTAADTTVRPDFDFERAASVGATGTSMHTGSCEETDGCGRLEATRSGVGVSSAPESEDAKRKPETAAKRHVMQSVRSIW